ncbi:MAG: UMP kinase [Desulfurococcaceae archaeon]
MHGDLNTITLKITGKAFDDPSLVKNYIDVFAELLEKYKLLVVTGGGQSARRYIEIAEKIGIESNYWLDLIGIWASRINGLMLISALSNYAYPSTPSSIEEALVALKHSKLVVMGGLIPGQSTASVLLQMAEAIGTRRVFYYSAIGKVYSKDPNKYPDAAPFSIITASELKSILEQRILPGEYALIDTKALDIAIRSKIEIQILNYKEPGQIFKAIRGENPGTIIIPK